MMAAVIFVAVLLISAGTIAGFFEFQSTIPVYILLVIIVPAWFAARRVEWRWLAILPVLLCFSLGILGSLEDFLSSNFVLFYALAVLLAGMLLTNRVTIVLVIASTLVYGGLGLRGGSSLIDALPALIPFFFALVGMALLQGYTYSRMRQGLAEQITANAALQSEITHREQVEHMQREQETQLRRLAENTTDLVLEMDAEGLVRYASPSHRSVLGIEPESLLGTNAFNLVHLDDRAVAYETASQSGRAARFGTNPAPRTPPGWPFYRCGNIRNAIIR